MRNTRAEPETVRFSVSMEPDLVERFDRLAGSGSAGRSKVLRDLIRARLAEAELRDGKAPSVGVLSYVYTHDQPGLSRRLAAVGHAHHAEVVSSTHVHLDRRDCLEVLILRGPAARLRTLADRIAALHGVRQARLNLVPATCPLARHHRKHQGG
jgi:CopG family nickel-responsive transcriptional regulator